MAVLREHDRGIQAPAGGLAELVNEFARPRERPGTGESRTTAERRKGEIEDSVRRRPPLNSGHDPLR